MAKYIAWNRAACDEESFDTEAEAIKYCEDAIEVERSEAFDDGWSDEAGNGGIGYARVIAESTLVVTDSKDNYPCLRDANSNAECSSCQPHPSCEGTEGWAYEERFDEVSECVLQKQEDLND